MIITFLKAVSRNKADSVTQVQSSVCMYVMTSPKLERFVFLFLY